jgi:hypothetical protein
MAGTGRPRLEAVQEFPVQIQIRDGLYGYCRTLIIFDSTKSDRVGPRVEGRLHISISPLAIHAEILYPFCQSILASVPVAIVAVRRDHDEYGRNGLQML